MLRSMGGTYYRQYAMKMSGSAASDETDDIRPHLTTLLRNDREAELIGVELKPYIFAKGSKRRCQSWEMACEQVPWYVSVDVAYEKKD